jgi:hypothetical protein
VAHTETVNRLPFETGVMHLMDCEGTPVAVGIVKATFTIEEDGLRLAEKQQPLLPGGKLYGEPRTSSYRYEPECAYYKPATDVILVGAAIPPGGAADQVMVEFSVGPLRKRAMVFGDRYWVRSFGIPYRTPPEPFDAMPLVYERSFGGCGDRRNPVGVGFAHEFGPGEDRLSLPNIEDPACLISDFHDCPKPIGFGFTSPDWQPRATLAGSYDESWSEERAPLPPSDFNPRFFNAASEGLLIEGRLRGTEKVELHHCAAQPHVIFALPGVPPPVCHFKIAGRRPVVAATELDTVVINTVERMVILTCRCHVALPRGPESLLELRFEGGN